jgi:hypothetical protein
MYSIQKHGKEKHTREILELFDSKEEMFLKEKEIVNKELLNDTKCMNLKKGGKGGLPNFSKSDLANFHEKGGVVANRIRGKKHSDKLKFDVFYRERWIEAVSSGLFEKTGSRNGWKGKKHSENTIEAMRISRKTFQSGVKNSQFGKVWIFNEHEKRSIAVKREEIEKFFAKGWKKGRKKFVD